LIAIVGPVAAHSGHDVKTSMHAYEHTKGAHTACTSDACSKNVTLKNRYFTVGRSRKGREQASCIAQKLTREASSNIE